MHRGENASQSVSKHGIIDATSRVRDFCNRQSWNLCVRGRRRPEIMRLFYELAAWVSLSNKKNGLSAESA